MFVEYRQQLELWSQQKRKNVELKKSVQPPQHDSRLAAVLSIALVLLFLKVEINTGYAQIIAKSW
jgi:hypothetical protein